MAGLNWGRSAFFLGLMMTAEVSADTVRLKSGEVIEGKITIETADYITIAVAVTPSITEERIVNGADIAVVDKTTPDALAFREVMRIASPPEFCTNAGAYETVLEREVRPFLKKYPDSPSAPAVRALEATLERERAVLAAGGAKAGGVLLSPEAYLAERYQVDAGVLADTMARAMKREDFVRAANAFVALERSYPNSVAAVEARPLARRCFEALIRRWEVRLSNAPLRVEEMKQAVDRTPLEARAREEAAAAEKKRAAAARGPAARTAGLTFFDPSEIDAAGLTEMKKAATTALATLAAGDDPRKVQAVARVRESERDFAKAEFVGSLASAQNAGRLWPEYEGLGRLLARVQGQLQRNEASSRRQAEYLQKQRDAGTAPDGGPVSIAP